MLLAAWGIVLFFSLTLVMAYTEIALAFIDARRKEYNSAMRNIMFGLLFFALTVIVSAPVMTSVRGVPGIIGGIAWLLAAIGLMICLLLSDQFEQRRYTGIINDIQERSREQTDGGIEALPDTPAAPRGAFRS